MTVPRISYSYIRFSAKKQERGDSIRRQTEMTTAFCQRRGWTLCEKNYSDFGVSAFRGKNALVGNLGEFFKAVEAGEIKPGSALIVESLDRISRQGIDEGYEVIKKILKAGIILVTLSPEREFDISATKSLSKGALEIQLILERAAEESERKSVRSSSAHESRRSDLRAGKRDNLFCSIVPCWCRVENKKVVGGRVVGGTIAIDEPKAEIVRRIFRMAADGYGAMVIAKQLNAECVPHIGKCNLWSRGHVGHLLRNRRVLGEWQPEKNGKPDGDPIQGYFRRIISDEEFYAARAGAEERRGRPGREASEGVLNLFAGLLKDVRDGSGMIMDTRFPKNRKGQDRKRHHCLANATGDMGKAKIRSFPYPEFERLILSKLREIDPAKVIGESRAGDEARALQAEKDEVRGRIAGLEAELVEGASAALSRVVRQLEEREKALADKLEKAKATASRPLEGAWGEFKTLADALEAAPEPTAAKLRLRSLLRQIISEGWVLIVPNGVVRMAVVQLFFKDGGSRSYWLFHRPPHFNFGGMGAGYSRAMSDRHPDNTDKQWLLSFGEDITDIRDPKQQANVERFLTGLSKDNLSRLLSLPEYDS